MFNKILIANRGEIAVRIIQSCKKMGIGTVAVYSEIDARALHVREADESVCLGPNPSTLSYLVKEKIIAAALAHHCQAIHPGYGFLSENAEFAALTIAAGLAFIGPQPEVIEALGNKISAKKLAIAAGVPVVPGHHQALADVAEAEQVAQEIGFPLLLKPAAGGGGRGMRIVRVAAELAAAFQESQEEMRKGFGDDTIFIERYLDTPRHIEIQIIADHHGRVLHLGERECSIQRRYQKVIEESPSPALDPQLRQRMGETACALARAAGYTNAGTVEFIFAPNGDFYFLEMNTRLQVEHPVTELVTGYDLVELQLRVAAGEPLPMTQAEVKVNGWAMEARICAEDPGRNFLPSTGLVTRYAKPQGEAIRVDSGIEAGSLVSVYYDSMLAKVICWGATREAARQGLVQALNRYHLEGVSTNSDFANAILNHPAFIAGLLNTNFIADHFVDGRTLLPPAVETLHSMVIAVAMVYHNRQHLVWESLRPLSAHVGAGHEQKNCKSYTVVAGEKIFTVKMTGVIGSHDWQLQVDDREYEVRAPDFEYYRRRLKLQIAGQEQYFRLQYRGNFIWAAFCGLSQLFEIYTPREWELAQFMPKGRTKQSENILRAPMPGLVVEVKVEAGERVYRGQDLVILESMKMASGVSSPCDGEVAEILVRPGQTVDGEEVMIRFKP